MPVSVTCRCGHRFKVAGELAGRRVRCPACQAVVAVPDPDRDDEAEEPRPKKAKRRDPEDDAAKALDRDALHRLMPDHKRRPGCGTMVLVLAVVTAAAVAAVRAAAATL